MNNTHSHSGPTVVCRLIDFHTSTGRQRVTELLKIAKRAIEIATYDSPGATLVHLENVREHLNAKELTQ